MRLLRTTRRGTWLTAVIVWLAGCAAIWYLMPIVPRAVIPRGEAGEVLGFTDDGRGAYGVTWGRFNPERDYSFRDSSGPIPDGPFRVWDLQTGLPRVTWELPKQAFVDRWLPSYPAALVFSHERLPADGMPLTLFDFRSGRQDRIPLDAGCLADEPFALTPDGRYLGYLTLGDRIRVLHWFDRVTKKVVATFPAENACQFRADGCWASVQRHIGAHDKNVVLIREPVTGRLVTRYETDDEIELGGFSSDGRCLLVSTTDAWLVIDDSGHRSRIPTSSDTVSIYFVDSKNVVTHHIAPDGSDWLNRWDAESGAQRGRYKPPDGFGLDLHFGPNSRHILLVPKEEPGLIDRLPTWAQQFPAIDHLLRSDVRTYRVLDGLAGQLLGDYRLTRPARVQISPDGQTLANVSVKGTIELWDIPARTTWSRVAAPALLWALPVACVARRRERTLARSLSRSC